MILHYRQIKANSNHLIHLPPARNPPRNKYRDPARRQTAPAPDPPAQIPMRPRQRARNGRPEQDGHRHDREGHTETRAHVALVGREPHKRGRLQREERAREEAVHDRDRDQAALAVRRGEAERSDGHDEDGGADHVEDAGVGHDKIRHDAADDGGAVEDGEEVEGDVRGGEGVAESVGLHVDVGGIHAEEEEAAGAEEEEEGRVAEDGAVDPGAAGRRRLEGGGLDDEEGDAESHEGDQGEDEDGPAEAYLGLHRAKEGGQDEAGRFVS